MSDLLVGTDRRTLLSAAPAHGTEPTTSAVPAGLRHAVPRGGRVALCGEAPPILWDAVSWPGAAHQQDVCPLCRRLSSSG